MNLELCKLHHLQNKPNQQISSHSDGWSERQSCSDYGEEAAAHHAEWRKEEESANISCSGVDTNENIYIYIYT